MLQQVTLPHTINERDLHITASIGVSVYPDDGMNAETLIKNADTAMYQAKEKGRQNYQFFKPAMNVRAVERQYIEEGLRRALERRELVVHYQPKVGLGSRSDHRRGSADPLEPSDARPRPAGAVHSRRRGMRPHPADRRLGAARGLQTGARLGRRRAADADHGRQRLGDGVSRRRLSRRRVRDPRRNRARSTSARTGTHRERACEAGRVRGIHSPAPCEKKACRWRSTISAPAIPA